MKYATGQETGGEKGKADCLLNVHGFHILNDIISQLLFQLPLQNAHLYLIVSHHVIIVGEIVSII